MRKRKAERGYAIERVLSREHGDRYRRIMPHLLLDRSAGKRPAGWRPAGEATRPSWRSDPATSREVRYARPVKGSLAFTLPGNPISSVSAGGSQDARVSVVHQFE